MVQAVGKYVQNLGDAGEVAVNVREGEVLDRSAILVRGVMSVAH